MKDFPLRPEDKEVDELASEARIHSPEDAAAYVIAAAKRFGLDEVRMAAHKDVQDRLASAEYAAVIDPSRRISESHIVDSFNRIMEELGAPAWARTSAEEVHAARLVVERTLLPHGVSPSADGKLLNAARPVEAIYVLWLLELQRRSPAIPKEEVAQPPSNVPTQGEGIRRFQAYRPSPEALRREREYAGARNKYLTQHSDKDLATKIQELLTSLGID